MKTLLKIDSRSRKANALRDDPLPLEMLPKTNRNCGQVVTSGRILEQASAVLAICVKLLGHTPSTSRRSNCEPLNKEML
ncbi:hypothetical protein LCGC14_2862900 [marine sediment metagenome]|uniref:Uncharacterized protein n=1 Tax=marine sediment metagenome TaxID=412755 RepID=A0A0F8Y515_9ZZZZ